MLIPLTMDKYMLLSSRLSILKQAQCMLIQRCRSATVQLTGVDGDENNIQRIIIVFVPNIVELEAE